MKRNTITTVSKERMTATGLCSRMGEKENFLNIPDTVFHIQSRVHHIHQVAEVKKSKCHEGIAESERGFSIKGDVTVRNERYECNTNLVRS